MKFADAQTFSVSIWYYPYPIYCISSLHGAGATKRKETEERPCTAESGGAENYVDTSYLIQEKCTPSLGAQAEAG